LFVHHCSYYLGEGKANSQSFGIVVVGHFLMGAMFRLVDYSEKDLAQQMGVVDCAFAGGSGNPQSAAECGGVKPEQIRLSLGRDEWYLPYDRTVNDAMCEQSSNAFVWCRYVCTVAS
jgi:hypothetical protein